MRAHPKIFALLMAAMIVLAACGGATAPATSPGNEYGTTGGDTAAPVAGDGVDKSKLSPKLSIYTWADYIAPEVLTQFQTEYGVEVTVDVFDNNEDMIAKIRTGNSGYDVVFPSDYAVELMWKDKLIAPLDKSLLTNMKYLKPENMKLYYDPENTYSLPYNQGLTGVAYLKSKFATPPDSWAVLLDPAQAATIKGQFSMLDDEREVPGAALKLLGKSLNETNAEDLKKVEEMLKAQKEFIAAYDSSSVGRKLASGEVIIAQIYSNVAAQARLGVTSGDQQYPGNPDVGFFFPKEGGTIWQDNIAIVADSANNYTAHVFLNFMMRPEIAALNTKFNLGITPNIEAEKQLPPELQQLYKEGFAPDAAVLQRAEWLVRNDATAVFTDLWTAVKGE
ncbi:MAG: spermidine/putrescine ABC transporter substrate-binding protein [Roseiflexaceae bacterium]